MEETVGKWIVMVSSEQFSAVKEELSKLDLKIIDSYEGKKRALFLVECPDESLDSIRPIFGVDQVSPEVNFRILKGQ